MATNFEYLYKEDRQALVDLLYCRAPYHSCRICEFRKYGICPTDDDTIEYYTVTWLAQERINK